MKFLQFSLFALFLLQIGIGSYAQNQPMEEQIALIKKLEKKEIINRACAVIKEKYPDLEIDYHHFIIQVTANSKEIYVTFERYIKFIPTKSLEYYDFNISVHLLSKNIHPFDYSGTDNFYIPTKNGMQKIEFVKEHFFGSDTSYQITITETEKFYQISYYNRVSNGVGKIDKITGEGAVMSGIVPFEMEFPEIKESDPFIEIKQ